MAKKMKKAKRGKRAVFKKSKLPTRGRKAKGPSPKALTRAANPKKKRGPRAVAPPPRDVGILDAIGEVIAIVEELGQEMRDWADNMPESKQGSSKHDEVETCASTLEEQSGDDPTTSYSDEDRKWLNEIKVTIQDPTPKRAPRSRSARLGEATGILSDVLTKLEAYDTENADHETTITELCAALDDMEGELQGVDFPGMFG